MSGLALLNKPQKPAPVAGAFLFQFSGKIDKR
jgi:hypothetical protein